MGEMLVFRKGAWHTVILPAYIDPSWGVAERYVVANSLLADPTSFSKIEEDVYLLPSGLNSSLTSGLTSGCMSTRKTHRPPKNQEEEASVKKES